MPPPEHPLPGPKPKPPKPKPPKPRPEPLRDHAVPEVPLPPDPLACASLCTEPCAYHRLCPPLPPPAANVHLRSSSSSRLPTPLIALSASVLAASAVLLLVLLACHLLRLRRRRRLRQAAAAPHLGNAEAGGGAAAPPALSEGDEEDGVHHVWYIRTVGLDERAIAAITALVYDSGKGKRRRVGGGDDDDGCSVCLAEFRDGETLRLLPRCGHAFHRGCIDVWLRAHVNCPLCRAPVTAKPAPAAAATIGTTPSSAGLGAGEAAPAGADPAAAEEEGGGPPEPAAIRRAVSMVALPRRAPWPEVSLLREPASNSGREGGMGGLVKVSGVLKLSEALEMIGGRSMSFGAARSGQPTATGVDNAGETPR